MRKTYLLVLIVAALLCVASIAQAQTSSGGGLSSVNGATKDQLIAMFKSGAFDNWTADQIQQALQQAGISVQDAVNFAQQNGLDISKFVGKLPNGGAGLIDTAKYKQNLNPQQVNPLQQTPPQQITPIGQQSQQQQPGQQPMTQPTQPTVPPAPDTTKLPFGTFGLEYFGYKTFETVPDAFQPAAVGPVDPGYLVGPGDQLILSVWGQAEFQYELDVQPEGTVFIPNAGLITVSGTPLRGLQEKLKNQLSKYYAGLETNPPTVFLDVSISKTRPLRIFVTGDVKQPGGYTISSYATVFNALYAVGGPLKQGSLRGIKVIRENKVVATVDLYDYLVKGDQSADVRLQNNDIVFIPPRMKTVSVRGEVKRPAIYELKENEGMSELISFSGGLEPTAYLEKAQVERVRPFDQRAVGVEGFEQIDVDLSQAMKKGGKAIDLYDGDAVDVPPVISDKKNFVFIDGSVWRPGSYEITTNSTLKKLIASAQGLEPKTDMTVAHIVRMNEDLISKEIIPFDLGKVMDGSSTDIMLEPRDSVVIYGEDVTRVTGKFVQIFGEVKKPGKFDYRDNMTLADLILLAGGYTQDAYKLEAEVSRVNPQGLKGDTLAILIHPKLPSDFSGLARYSITDTSFHRWIGSDSIFLLQHRDEVLIRPNPDYKLQQNVTITGDITFPGTYSIEKRGERLSEIIARAGGPTTTSFLQGAVFTRGDKRLLVDFDEAYYKKNQLHDVVMTDSDKIVIPSVPRTVTVTGQVNNPGLISFVAGTSVGDYLDRAGGLTDSASYGTLQKPTGESQRVNFGFLRNNPEVPEGSTITIYKIPPPDPNNFSHFDLGGTIKDSFALLASAATIIYLIYQISK
jgi:protein involved in polysaccharide export with SLBB domain